MPILFNHLHKTGGLTVCHHLAKMHPRHFQTDPKNPNRSLREFAKLSKPIRHGFTCIMGHRAVELLPWCHPRTTAITVIRDPIERLVSLYQFLRDHPNLHYHPIAKAYSLGQCCEMIGEFQNYYDRWLKLERMKYVFLSPGELLQAMGYQGEVQRLNRSTPAVVTDEDLRIARERNADDLRIWNAIQGRAKLGRFTVRQPSAAPAIRKQSSPADDRRKALSRPLKPTPRGTILVTPHFNPAGFPRMVETYREWRDAIGYDHVVYEANDRQEIAGSVFFKTTDRQKVFQKERLINLAIERNPGAEVIAWVDHDIIIDSPSWLESAAEMIRSGFDAVQLFESMEDLAADWSVAGVAESGAKSLLEGRYAKQWPGGAWAASRDYLSKIRGLYGRNVVGGGDVPFFNAATGAEMPGYLDRQSPRLREAYLRWIGSAPRARWGVLPGGAKHIWHGPRKNRGYVDRDRILAEHSYDPDRHITIGENGLLEWSSDAPAGLPGAVARYFASRADG